MPSNQTTNYQLSQWAKSDQVRMEDFNADNAKIDAAIKAVDTLAGSKADAAAVAVLSQTVAAHASTLTHKGNCQVYYTTYTGNGQATRTFTFPHKPLLVFAMGENLVIRTVQGLPETMCRTNGETGGCRLTTSWSGNSFTWSNANQTYSPNANGRVFYMVVLMDASN